MAFWRHFDRSHRVDLSAIGLLSSIGSFTRGATILDCLYHCETRSTLSVGRITVAFDEWNARRRKSIDVKKETFDVERSSYTYLVDSASTLIHVKSNAFYFVQLLSTCGTTNKCGAVVDTGRSIETNPSWTRRILIICRRYFRHV